MPSTRRLLLIALAFAALWPAAAAPARAQQQLGGIQGTIADQTHGVLPGVAVTVTNLETGVARSATTNESGLYRVLSLEPGRYKAVAELSGFRAATQTDLVVSVGATIGVNFTMQTGSLTEAVTVSGVAPDIQTEKADISAVVEQKKINDLPLVGRNVLSLAALQPGINGIPGTQDFLAPEQGMGVTANGVRESGNNATIDGASINNGPWGGTVILVPNVDAVQEYQVIANNPSAEYGRNAGATVSVITKGGTNTFSGTVYEFHRNQNLRARGYFDNRAIPKPDFHRNDFGGSFGGPIRRNNTFFFVSAEVVRELTGTTSNSTVETQQLVNWVTANRPNSIAAQLFRRHAPPSYPTTDVRDIGGPLPGANVWSTTPDGIPDVGTISVINNGPRDGDQFNARVDQVFRGGRDRLRATYYLANVESQFLYVRPQFNHPYPFRNQVINVAHTWMVSATTLNEATFGLVRQHGEAGDPTPETPNVGPGSGVAGFGVEFWHPIDFTQNNFQFKDTLTMNRGRHSFRTGAELRLGRDGATLHHWERPNYNFQSILDFIDDEPFGEDRAVDPATGLATTAYGKYLTNEWAVFFQDNWKARPNLTLNLGLRYDNFGNPTKDQIPYNGIILGAGSTRAEQVATAKVGKVDRLFDTDWNNFAPRFGITWDPTSTGKFVLRGGGGISYNRINNTVYTDERLNPPQFAHAFGSIQDGTPIVYRSDRITRRTPRSAGGSTRTGAFAARAWASSWSIQRSSSLVLQLVLRRAVPTSVALRRRSELQRIGRPAPAERRRAGRRGLQPVLGRSPRRHPQSAQSQLRGGRAQREPHRLQLSRDVVPGAAALHEGPGVPDVIHVRRGEGQGRQRHDRRAAGTRLQLRGIRHPPQAGDECRMGSAVQAGQRDRERGAGRMAGQQHRDLPDGGAVHRHLRLCLPAMRLQCRRRQQRSREPAELRNRPRRSEPGGVGGGRAEGLRLPASGDRPDRQRAEERVPRTAVQERRPVAVQELPAERCGRRRLDRAGAPGDVQRLQLGQPEQPDRAI